jgi:hypothetical protein
VLFTGKNAVVLPVVVRVRFRLFVVFLMRETALPQFSFVVFISMRYAGFNVGQRVAVRFREFGFSVVVSLMRFRVSHPVVAFALLCLGFGFARDWVLTPVALDLRCGCVWALTWVMPPSPII